MELASRKHSTGVDRNPILVSSEMLSNSILESPNFQNFLCGYATRPPSCYILCMQVLFVQYWNKLHIL